MNIQKRMERQTESWNTAVKRQEAMNARETFEGRARIRNAVAAEMFDNTEVTEDDLLDFGGML